MLASLLSQQQAAERESSKQSSAREEEFQRLASRCKILQLDVTNLQAQVRDMTTPDRRPDLSIESFLTVRTDLIIGAFF